MKREKHVNIPVFIPHLGCPNNCVFCNQRYISGVREFVPENARDEIDKVLSSVRGSGVKCEIAFFGGSFTGIDRNLMISLLDLAEKYVKRGEVDGIRMSTRPDYINGEIIDILKRYTVSAVELGIQSFDEKVLSASKRGHTADDSRRAMKSLKDAGFSTVGQMMIGLPESTPESERECAREICSLGAVGARIYPTIVFNHTELCAAAESGEYIPLTVDEAVERSADVLEIFRENGVECLRIGLCESENLHSEESYYAGPNHPSLGELVHSEIYRRKITEKLDHLDVKGKRIVITVPSGDISQAVGQGGKNKKMIIEKYGSEDVKFKETRTSKYSVGILQNEQQHKGEKPCT